MSRRLKLLGYWHSLQEPYWPDPARFVDRRWDCQVRAKTVVYLQKGYVVAAAAGRSWCRFRCGIEGNGSAVLTDGAFLWPEGLVHYVAVHDVRMPDEFIEHVLSTADALEQRPLDEPVSVDTTWWASQQGCCSGQSWKSPGYCGRMYLRSWQTPLDGRALAFLRRLPDLAGVSLQELRLRLERSEPLLLSTDTTYWKYRDFAEAAAALGMIVEFEE